MSLSTPGLQELWVACGTKFGKTMAASVAMCYAAPKRRAGLFRWIAPNYAQSRIGFDLCKRLLPPEPYIQINKSTPHLLFPSLQDTKIEFKTGHDAEALEGFATNGNILDEASKLKEDVYVSVKTTRTITKGPIVGVSTPRGKGWFYKKCMEAKSKMAWCLKKGIPPTHIFLTAPSSANPWVTADTIQDARDTLPLRLFAQYFLAEFVDDGEVFSGFHDCIYLDEELEFNNKNFSFWIWGEYEEKDGQAQVDVVMGVDWGKHDDYTVITVWDYKQKRMIGLLRFRGVNYMTAIKYLVLFARRFRKVEMINHDKTGLGEVLDDKLAETDLNYEGVTFTNAVKNELVNSLMLAIEQRIPQFPRWDTMMSELDAFEVTTNALGTMIYSAPGGQHDDIVTSMILGWQLVMEYADINYEVSFVGDKPSKEVLPLYDDAMDDVMPGYRIINL